LETQTYLSLVQEIYAGFGQGDLSPLLGAAAEDIVWSSHSHPSSPFHGVWRGAEALPEYFGNMAEIQLEKFDIHTMMEANNRVVALIDVRRITTATGDITEGQFVHVLKFEGDKLTQVDIYEASADK
jgi:ketosteroid isomerase-like protein